MLGLEKGLGVWSLSTGSGAGSCGVGGVLCWQVQVIKLQVSDSLTHSPEDPTELELLDSAGPPGHNIGTFLHSLSADLY